MKKILVLSIGMIVLAAMNSFGQTKKVAHRSHSGNEMDFDIYSPDDFGGGPLMKKMFLQHKDSIALADSLKKCVKPNSSLDAPSIIPEPIELPKPKAKPKPQLKKKQKMKAQSTTAKVKGTATLSTEKKATNFLKKTTKSVEKATKETPKKEKGSLSWLVLLLTIPAVIGLFLKLKK